MMQIRKIGSRIKKVICVFLIFVIYTAFIPKGVFAESNQFINIVNPVRISRYTKDPEKALQSQYSVINRLDIPATWLVTFDVLKNKQMLTSFKTMKKNQEIGLFLEVTPDFAQAAGVMYHDTGSWHHANSVFLSGYTQEERKLLIDTLFIEFKNIFGYYPVSVGSWWTDSFSLSYMKDKYGIAANLTCADQFSTDGYQIWGQFWGVPYYPSSYHAGIPAGDKSSKLDLVTIQWAPRDPLNGYKSSLYSTQDYPVVKEDLTTDYFEKIVNLYVPQNTNSFGQITVGLESDLDPEGYKGEFTNQMERIKSLSTENTFSIVTMSTFANWYRETFKNLSPSSKIKSGDFLETKNKVIWYQSPKYRAGVLYDHINNRTKIFDLRIYNKDLIEPYFVSPNRETNLSIYIHSLIDEVSSPTEIIDMMGEVNVDFEEDRIIIHKSVKNIPLLLKRSTSLSLKRSINKLTIEVVENQDSTRGGLLTNDFSAEAIHFFKQKKFPLYLLKGEGWNYFNKVEYLIPQGEVEALERLSTLSQGKVLVYDHECLQCEYHTRLKPPALDNRRRYVKKLGKHSIVYNSSVFLAKDQKTAKQEFDKLRVKYVYLVKFEGYIEKLPFSPGDFEVEKVFSNANTEIWKVQ